MSPARSITTMMESTPPPPERLHTPPGPLHGSRYDDYQPYSPRRSARVSSLRTRHQSPTADADAGTGTGTDEATSTSTSTFASRLSFVKHNNNNNNNTSTPRKATPLQRASSSQTLSPPASPQDAQHYHHHHQSFASTPVRPSSVRRSLFPSHKPSRPSDIHPPHNTLSPEPLLPTPSKTPNKRAPAFAMPATRALSFKPANLDDVMPSPRKQRKSRLTLFSDDDPKESDIAVFTDAQNRLPDVDPSDDNPFLGPRKKPAKSKSSNKSVAANDGNEADMEEAAKNDEGIIYVFRGKKVFRRFSSPSAQQPGTSNPADRDQANLKRKAGITAHRPFTRSSLKPRLLWPAAEGDQPVHPHANQDEEADTDIEEHHLPVSDLASVRNLVTPAKKLAPHPHLVLTPPESHRATRSASKKLSFLSVPETISEATDPEPPLTPSAIPTPQARAATKKTSPFDSWQRTKPHTSAPAPQGRKRALSPQPQVEQTRKRTRRTANRVDH